MTRLASVSRPALRWLLISQLLILAPLALQLPIWLMALAVAVMFWRFQLSRSRWGYPLRWVKVLMALAVTAALVATFRNFAMDAMVSLLVAGFVLKLLELRSRSDVCLLSFLSYFVVGTQLLYTSGLIGSFYALLCMMATTATLMVNTMTEGTVSNLKPVRKVGLLLIQAVPVMLILFFVVPRIGSLWTVPLNSSAGTTGVSSSMSPGDFSSLMESDKVAFRATFNGDVPPARDLYWRALVLDHFDGRTWEQSSHQDLKARGLVRWDDWRSELSAAGSRYDYDVMLEPTDENWLYTLAAPVSFSGGIWVSRGMTLYQRNAVSQRKQYSVASYSQYQLQPQGMSDVMRRLSLQLPAQFNPKTRAMAQQWAAEASDVDALVQRFLTFIASRFHYTLRPPMLGEHSVDEFLIETQTGFCEHFASSFVFFMRAAGVPARVVAGYQGGKVNPLEGYLTVRQLDAHAWAEVWIEGKGWLRVDPTFAVAPERIDRGVEYSLGTEDTELLGDAWSRRFFMLANLQDRLDVLNYRWHRWVMNYDSAAQQALLRRLFGNSPPWRITLAVMGAIAVVVLLIMLPSLLRLFGQRSPWLHRQYRALCRALERQGYSRKPGEGARDFAARVTQRDKALGAMVMEATELFEAGEYRGEVISPFKFRWLVYQVKAKRYAR